MLDFRAINARPIKKRDFDVRNEDEKSLSASSTINALDDYRHHIGAQVDVPSESESENYHTDDTDPLNAAIMHSITGTEPAPMPIDSRCEARIPCRTGSGDHRKTISHIFGRNKAETRAIDDYCWIKWCRMHYQRKTYRERKEGRWHKQQLQLVREQLDKFETTTDIQSWNVGLRKKEQQMLDVENAAVAAGLITLASPSQADHVSGNTTIAPLLSSTVLTPIATAIPSGTARPLQRSRKPAPRSAKATPCSARITKRSASIAESDDDSGSVSDAATTVSYHTNSTPATEHSDNICANSNEKYHNDPNADSKTTLVPQVWERFLVPHLGPSKSYSEVRTICDIIEREFQTSAFQDRDEKARLFPGIEFLPVRPNTTTKKPKTQTLTTTARGTKRKAVDATAVPPAAPSKRPRLMREAKA